MHRFIIFIAILLGLLFAVNLYLYTRTCQTFVLSGTGKLILGIVLGFLAISYILAQVFQAHLPFSVTAALQLIGSTWLMVLLYGLMAAALFDFLRLLNHFFHIFPAFVTAHYAMAKVLAYIGVVSTITILFVIGNVRFNHPVTTNLTIDLSDKYKQGKEINIVAVSDLHLGYTVRTKHLERFVHEINNLHPDIILMAGDVVDNSPKPIIMQNMQELLKKLQAPMGIYACTGNHEYIGDAETSCKYLQQAGIHELRDTEVLVNNSFYLAGREDISSRHSKKLADILVSRQKEFPIIVLDHQPSRINESVANQVDLHISGHTHGGQIFPITLITRKIYEIAYGYKQKENTHIYVSSGLGIWGPQIRLGSVSEIVNIKLKW